MCFKSFMSNYSLWVSFSIAFKSFILSHFSSQSCQFIQFNSLCFIHFKSSTSSNVFQVIHFNVFMSMRLFHLFDHSFISSFLHSFTSSFLHSFNSVPSCHFLHLNSLMSIPLSHFPHFNWFVSIHSFISCISFHFSSLLSNSPKVPISHVPFSKLPPGRVPGTTWDEAVEAPWIFWGADMKNPGCSKHGPVTRPSTIEWGCLRIGSTPSYEWRKWW